MLPVHFKCHTFDIPPHIPVQTCPVPSIIFSLRKRERAREGFVLIQNDPRSFSLGETDNRSQLLARQALIESCDVAQGLIKSFWLLIISLDGNNVLLRAIRSRAVQMNEGARGEGQRWLICKWIHYDTCTHTTRGRLAALESSQLTRGTSVRRSGKYEKKKKKTVCTPWKPCHKQRGIIYVLITYLQSTS